MEIFETLNWTCLVAEDDSLVSMDLEDGIGAAGFRTQGVASVSAALSSLDTAAPDIAIIESELRKASCVDLARILKRREIPFVIYSAAGPGSAPPEFDGVPWIDKPASMQIILEALGTTLRDHASNRRSRPEGAAASRIG